MEFAQEALRERLHADAPFLLEGLGIRASLHQRQ